MLSTIRSGNWITRDRIVVYAALLLAGYIGAVVWILGTSTGLVDAQGRAVGTDFAAVWSAGKLALNGTPALAYDWPSHRAEQQLVFGDQPVRYTGWHYPPPFMLIAGALAALPYLPAIVLWQGMTLALYLICLYAILPRRIALLAALAYPAVLINLLHGQNGFLTAALLGGGLYLLRSRPVQAGILFGLLVYKPHFAFLLPVALAAGGHWRSFAAAAATVVLVCAVSFLLLGEASWTAFLDSTTLTRTVILEAGATGWHKIQSVFSMVRMAGGPVALAYAAQAVVSLFCAAAVVWLWRSHADFSLKAAGLIAASLLATPYQIDYDLMALAPAIAFMAAHGLSVGFGRYAKSLLALVWVVPLVTRSIALVVPVSAAVITTTLLLAAILLWAERQTASTP